MNTLTLEQQEKLADFALRVLDKMESAPFYDDEHLWELSQEQGVPAGVIVSHEYHYAQHGAMDFEEGDIFYSVAPWALKEIKQRYRPSKAESPEGLRNLMNGLFADYQKTRLDA